MLGWIRRRRRRRIAAEPTPETWLAWLDEHAPFFAGLEGEERARFVEYLKVFVREKHFIGAGGLEVTEEMKVVVAACAVRLALHLGISVYDRLTEIVLYPSHYRHPDEDEHGTVVFGEAHDWGVVVLSWEAVLAGLANPRDGRETAAHEFAHVLDRGTGDFNGTPALRASEHYRAWARVMSRHYLELRDGGDRQRKVLRDYGAQNEAEFFAVATESFFEKPRQMSEHTPDLYAELVRFYGWDPLAEPPER